MLNKTAPLNILFITTLFFLAANLPLLKNINDFMVILGPAILLSLLLLWSMALSKKVFYIFIFFLLPITAVGIYFRWLYQASIDEDILLSLFINDWKLSSEMINPKLVLWTLSFTFLSFYFLTRFSPNSKLTIKKVFTVTIILSLMFAAWLQLIGYELKGKGEIRDPKLLLSIHTFTPVDILVSTQRALKSIKKIKQYTSYEKLSERYQYQQKPVKDLTIVVIIGESTRGDHMHLNGYKEPTTPKLETLSNLISFPHVSSCDTLTLRSLPCMVSPLETNQTNRIPTQSSFAEVLHALGFYTYIFSLQGLDAFYHYLGYDQLMSKYAIIEHNKTIGAKDEALLPFLAKALKDRQHHKKLIILHTIGSHYRYLDRIQKKDRVFQPICHSSDLRSCSKDQITHMYDNTIYAIDNFLYHAIDLMKNQNAIVFYTSDHGESLGENGYYLHGAPLVNAPKEQRNVPFIIWASPLFLSQKEEKDRFEHLKKISQHKTISHDYLFHSILGCSGITSDNKGIKADLNLCQHTYMD